MADNSTDWTVYILQCADDSLYTGIARNLDARIAQHNAGKGAKYTRGRAPVSLVYRESATTQGDALRREYQIKQLSTAAKRDLIAGN
ncbi:MAG: GIY-YIG nuclease family protein [bacterium]